ncbi:MAG: 4-hydroxy-tetrahydrodipicolinate synthase [bacterium]
MSMLLKKLGAVLLPLVTPFDKQDRVNPQALADLVEFIIANGYADAFITTGSTGEFYTLSPEERILVWQTVKEANRGRLPLIAGTGAASTREAVAFTKKAEEIGFDCVMVVSPYYQKATQRGLYVHFKAVAEATSLPVVIYNIPLFTGVNVEPETLKRLLDFPNLVGIKEEAGIQPLQTTLYRLIAPETFTIYCGDDTMVLQTLPQGAVGVVSGGSHVIGDLMKQMIQLYWNGDVRGASDLYLKLFPFFSALIPPGHINPIPILKTVTTLTSGIDMGAPRLPGLAATDAELEVIKSALRPLGKLP